MNSASQLSFNANLIFGVVAVLIVLSLVMGRRNRTTNRSNYGWWIGLGVLLAIASGFLGIFQLRVSPITETRHSDRSPFHDVRQEVRIGIETAQDSLQQGLDEVSKGMAEVQQSLGALSSKQSSSKSKRKPPSTPAAPVAPSAPLETLSWVVEVKDEERRQKKDDVKQLLMDKAAASVNRWVNERMPLKNVALNFVTPDWLQERGAFAEPIDYQTEQVPRLDPALKDPVLGGTMKVVLTPSVQQNLIEQGYHQLDAYLKNEQFQAQGIISIVLLGITCFVGILGLVKTVVFRRVSAYTGQQAA